METFTCDLPGGPVSVPVRPLSRKEWAQVCYSAPLDDETFPPALIAACTGMSLDEAQEAWDEWPTLDAEALYDLCLELSQPGSWDWAKKALQDHPRLTVELAVCKEYGIPHSQFLDWSDIDQDLAVAAFIDANDKCPGCGAPGDAMDNPNLAKITGRRCYKCQELKGVRNKVPEELRPFYHLSIVRSDNEPDGQ